MRYLNLSEVLYLHQRILEMSGGSAGIRDLGGLESALAQPKQSFGGSDLYPSLIEKAAALCYSIVGNHPFVDGNKRVAHAVMETFLILNGVEIIAHVDEQERLMLALAAGEMAREAHVQWLQENTKSRMPMGSLIRNSTGTRGKATYRGKDLTGARSPQRELIPDMSGRTRMSQPPAGNSQPGVTGYRSRLARKRAQPRNRMREYCTSGSVRRAPGNRRPYRGGFR